MKERLIQLLDLEQLTPSKFADIIGVQRSSISHVISGRNKPSFDFLQKTLRAFPGLNASWLLMGEGSMYEQMGRRVSGNLFEAATTEEGLPEEHIQDQEVRQEDIPEPEGPSEASGMSVEQDPDPAALNREGVPADSKRIVQVMVFYDDDSFRTFRPAN